jgi:hypothetical protein
MYDLFLGNSRINNLEDAYNTLVKINTQEINNKVNKADFHELKNKPKNQT